MFCVQAAISEPVLDWLAAECADFSHLPHLVFDAFFGHRSVILWHVLPYASIQAFRRHLCCYLSPSYITPPHEFIPTSHLEQIPDISCSRCHGLAFGNSFWTGKSGRFRSSSVLYSFPTIRTSFAIPHLIPPSNFLLKGIMQKIA